MQLVVDIDQTIYPLLKALQTLPGGEEVEEEKCLHWDSLASLCQRPLGEMIEEAIHPELAASIGLYPGARETILYFLEQDMEVALATHRHHSQEEVTRTFLADHELDHLPLFIGEDLEKLDLLFPSGVLIDDAPHTLSKGALTGKYVTTLAHPYNNQVAEKHGLSRGEDWQELKRIVEGFFKQRGE